MSRRGICLGGDMRQDWHGSIWGIKLLLTCLNKRGSRRMAAGLVFGVTHAIYTMDGVFCHHGGFPSRVCATAGKNAVSYSSAFPYLFASFISLPQPPPPPLPFTSLWFVISLFSLMYTDTHTHSKKYPHTLPHLSWSEDTRGSLSASISVQCPLCCGHQEYNLVVSACVLPGDWQNLPATTNRWHQSSWRRSPVSTQVFTRVKAVVRKVNRILILLPHFWAEECER